jgi:hypothetical protein
MMSALRKLGLLLGLTLIAWGMGATSSFACATFNTCFVDADAGSDSNTGAVTSPFATLNKALAASPCGGNIEFIHGGAFGPIYLSCQISIIGPADSTLSIVANPGVPTGCITGASCPTAGNTAIQIASTTPASDLFKFKDLLVSMGSNSSTTNAMQIDAAFGVALTNVKLRGQGCSGSTSTQGVLYVDPSQTSQMQVYVHNSDFGFACNQGSVDILPSSSGNVYMNFSGGEVHNASYGISSSANSCTCNVKIAVDETQFFSFNNSAITVNATSSGTSFMVLARSSILNTGGAALKVNGANAKATLYENVISGNSAGVNVANSGFVGSFGNNQIFGNGPTNANNCESGGAPVACSSVLTSESLN